MLGDFHCYNLVGLFLHELLLRRIFDLFFSAISFCDLLFLQSNNL